VVTLYRCPAPTNYLCSCGRVARELDAKGIENEQLRVPWRKGQRSEVEALSGQNVVPLLVTEEGEVICDSRRILQYLRSAVGESQVGSSAQQGAPTAPEPVVKQGEGGASEDR
jgi:glutathione S-transferase